MRQSYKREMKGLSRDQRFRNHSKNRKKAQEADHRMKTIAMRLVRELECNLLKKGLLDKFTKEIALYYHMLAQKKDDKDKIYSMREPEVECISKGREHKKYEFGNKVSIMRTWNKLVIGALSFRNEYDGPTIDRSLDQVERLVGRRPKLLASNRGYRGQKQSDTSEIAIPDVSKVGDSYYKKWEKHKLFCKRVGIEPIIGHLKETTVSAETSMPDGVFGDNINVMLRDSTSREP